MTNLICSFLSQKSKKRITYRVAYDGVQDVINSVPLGKEAPLSKCCMTYLNFVFTRDVKIGGKVVCTNSLCTKGILDRFEISE